MLACHYMSVNTSQELYISYLHVILGRLVSHVYCSLFKIAHVYMYMKLYHFVTYVQVHSLTFWETLPSRKFVDSSAVSGNGEEIWSLVFGCWLIGGGR